MRFTEYTYIPSFKKLFETRYEVYPFQVESYKFSKFLWYVITNYDSYQWCAVRWGEDYIK